MKTWQDYVKEVMVTCATTKPREVQGLVLALGLCGEAREAFEETQLGDCPHLIDEELGDFLWYAAALTAWADLQWDFAFQDFSLQSGSVSGYYKPLDLMIFAASVAERMKKHIGHDRILNKTELERELAYCVTIAEAFCNGRLQEVCEKNIAKLRLRFKGGGFDSALSAAKADEVLPFDASKGS